MKAGTFWTVIILIIAIVSIGYFIVTADPSAPRPSLPVVFDSATSTITIPGTGQSASTTAEVLEILDKSSWRIFVDSAGEFSLEHPNDMTEGSRQGVATFVFPKNLYYRWPLLDDASVKALVLPASACGSASSTVITLNGRDWNRVRTDEVAAGNRLTTVTYETIYGERCYRLEFVNRGANGAGLYVDSVSLAAKYDVEHTADMAKVLSVVHTMVSSFRIIAP